MKQKSYKEKETESTRGKKRYIERQVEEKEAKQQIKEFDRRELIEREEHIDNNTERIQE
jgi:hypothetical protein